MKGKRKPSGAAVIRPDVTQSLYRALFEEWAETGYSAISLERVATRAGAGKAAIYRRWPTKLQFATEALQSAGIALSDFSDHGSLTADLQAYLRTSHVAMRHRLIRRILPDIIAQRIRSPELSSALDLLASERRQQGNLMLDRAIARGELRPDLDRELALDVIPAFLFMRMIVRGQRVSSAELERQIRAVAAALAAC
ncbi:TetR/AcrR family transcriptional regulator [Epibacterium sp. Ofav1-8]|uniref:TetR/AcrR family transcriptional regulator n=1 Tax=Epibacterium sp. Ofav1-8 TaxID=2917735 RepID=UPI001EF6042D|nr:TetR/AcrR family transcriptional regulator [Epibacterium sp. Ofav1-8]